MRLVICAVAVAAATVARAESLVSSLSTSRVLISSNYTGSSIAVFGAIERDAQTIARASGYEAVVTVRGPRQELTVREKRKVGPIWVNRAEETFLDVPAFLAVLSSAPRRPRPKPRPRTPRSAKRWCACFRTRDSTSRTSAASAS